jgi:hypothetical protein
MDRGADDGEILGRERRRAERKRETEKQRRS